jgi:hypothetical protein
MREILLWSSPLRARSRTKSEQDVSRLLKTLVKQGRNVGLQKACIREPADTLRKVKRMEHSFSARSRGDRITDRAWERAWVSACCPMTHKRTTVPSVGGGSERLLEAARGQDGGDGKSSAIANGPATVWGGGKRKWGLTKTPIILESPV